MTAFQELSFFVYNHIKSLVFYIHIHLTILPQASVLLRRMPDFLSPMIFL